MAKLRIFCLGGFFWILGCRFALDLCVCGDFVVWLFWCLFCGVLRLDGLVGYMGFRFRFGCCAICRFGLPRVVVYFRCYALDCAI